jgi:hypothetical protein
MASEMRRTAAALVEHRRETFESRHPLEPSRARLARNLDAARVAPGERFIVRWREEGGRAWLDAEFPPPAATLRFLRVASLAMVLLVAGSAWAMLNGEEGDALRFLLPLSTVFLVLAFPFVALALGSRREAEESRIRKAIRDALADDDR